MERRALADLVIAVPDRCVSALEKRSEIGFTLSQRQRRQVAAVEVQQVEDEIDEVSATLLLCRVLDQRERGDAVWSQPAELAIEIGLPRRQRPQGNGDRRIFAGPGPDQQADIPAVEPGVHAIPVEFELVGPFVAGRRFPSRAA